jgi:type VI secretion system protein ImpK
MILLSVFENSDKQGSQPNEAVGLDVLISTLTQEYVLSRASQLALERRYAEAEGLLVRVIQSDARMPSCYDLLARILAQQGKLADAEQLWTHAVQLEPDNAHYQAALKRISETRDHPSRRRNIIVALTVMVLLAGVGILGTAINSAIEDRNTVRMIPTVKDATDSVHSDRDIRTSSSIPVVPSLEGVLCDRIENGIAVKFTAGLFVEGTKLSPRARYLLTKISQYLKPLGESITVTVIGYTDEIPVRKRGRYRDNGSLALYRAATVVDQLCREGTLPITLFSTRSGGVRSGVGSRGSTSAPNRTVEIFILARTQ